MVLKGLFGDSGDPRGILGAKAQSNNFNCFELVIPFMPGFSLSGSLANLNESTIVVPEDFDATHTEMTMIYTNFVGVNTIINFKIALAATPTTYIFEEQVTVADGGSGIASKIIPIEVFVPGTAIKILIEGEGANIYGTDASSEFLSSWITRLKVLGRYV